MDSAEMSLDPVILVGGHESSFGAELPDLSGHFGTIISTVAGRPFHQVANRLLDAGTGRVVVVPMTFGRDPRMVADVAKTLSWLSAGASQRLALAQPFGTLDHLTAWLRRAATQVRAASPDAAVALTADVSNPFDDAELYRIAHLVRTFGAGNEVDVALVDESGTAPTIERLNRLGYSDIVLVPAGFQRHRRANWPVGNPAGVRFHGPIMSDQAIGRIVRERQDAALHGLDHGDTGIAAGLRADHGHGYAHSHAFEGHSHDHTHKPGKHHHTITTRTDIHAH